MKNNKVYFNLFLIMFVGLLIRLTDINKADGLWNDEYVSWFIASKPLFADFIQAVYKNCHMPFYYVYLKFFMSFWGNEDIFLRILSVIPGMLGIFVMFLAGKEIKDEKTGLWCAAIVTFSGFMIYFSQEVRFYSLLFLFSACAILFSLKLLEKKTYSNLAGFYIFNLLIMFTHTIGFVFVFFNFLFVLGYLKQQNKISIKEISVIVSATVIAMLPFVPFLYKTLTDSYISQFWSDFSVTKLFFVFADYVSPIQINLVNTPLNISTLLHQGGRFNYGYVMFGIIPLTIAFIGLLNTAFKRNTKIVVLSLIGVATLLVMIIASSMGKIILITKYTVEIYPIFVILTAYGLHLIKPDFIRKFLLVSFFGLISLYLFVSDYAPQKLDRPEGHKLVANLIHNAKLKPQDRILLLYYDANRFEKYISFDDYFVETVTKYNFQYRLLNNPPSHVEVVKKGKDVFLSTFEKTDNDFFNNYLKLLIFDKLKKGDKFALIYINSVAFIDENRMKTVVADKALYKRMPFLFLIFSHIVNNTEKQADMILKPVYHEKQGKWEIFVWEKE